jgi:hypothetical protein
MSKSIIDIASDYALAVHDVELYKEEDVMHRVDELYTELCTKEDGIYWLYRNMEGQVGLVEENMAKQAKYIKTMKKAMERIKSLVVGAFEHTKELPRHSAFNPVKISKSAGAVDVIEEELIPKEYYIKVETFKLDKKRILEELKQGTSIPGVRLMQKEYVRGLK